LTRGQVRAVKTIITAPKVVNWTTPDITTRGAVNWFTPDKNLRGESFEKYLEKTKYSKENGYINLNERQPNHKTFDSYNPTTEHAVSIKTMDTLGLSGSNPMPPWRAAGYLRDYVEKVRSYERVGQPNGIYEERIQSRGIELAIPEGTPFKVREALDEVAKKALAKGVVVNISVVVK
ncbi:endonuclease toxin domain-containing protein, partial [Verminephrobacter aporrectodeae]|uniref:endonuclease toxin domain-containing protein n=1 Tax=Verminephrobacter aporrectodeae TaxID=1110389 RepID=UPI002243B43D